MVFGQFYLWIIPCTKRCINSKVYCLITYRHNQQKYLGYEVFEMMMMIVQFCSRLFYVVTCLYLVLYQILSQKLDPLIFLSLYPKNVHNKFNIKVNIRIIVILLSIMQAINIHPYFVYCKLLSDIIRHIFYFFSCSIVHLYRNTLLSQMYGNNNNLPQRTKTCLAFPGSSYQDRQSPHQTPHDIFPVLHQPPMYTLHHNNY